MAAIAEYAPDSGREVLDQLQVGAVTAHESTIRRVLQQLDPDAVDAALRSWTVARLATRTPNPPPMRRPRQARQVLAVDGKTLRVRHEVACGEWITSWRLPMVT